MKSALSLGFPVAPVGHEASIRPNHCGWGALSGLLVLLTARVVRRYPLGTLKMRVRGRLDGVESGRACYGQFLMKQAA